MANLNAWQKISRVLPGQPFGNGSDGAYSSATIPTLTKDSCSGTSGNKTLTTSGSTFANGDILLIHQARGTGVGQWEINMVVSGGGSTSLTLLENKQYTYTDSGASQAQAIKVPQYTDVTVQSGTWTLPSWDGNVSGVLPLGVKGTLVVTGTISANGSAASTSTPVAGIGFKGGEDAVFEAQAYAGEGSAGATVAQSGANGSGGGGGKANAGSDSNGSGGGGGNGGAGSNGSTTGTATAGTGGSVSGSADLVTMTFGGSGGGGGMDQGGPAGAGGSGGGAIIIFGKIITVAGSIANNGGAGGASSYGGGGGGAGGSILLACQTATLGTNLATATIGAGGTGSSAGGAGGVGRIAIHHSGTITGTTNPTFADVTDASLMEAGGSFVFNLL